MSEKQEIIRQLLAMQKKFIAREQSGDLEPKDYYDPEANSELDGYQSTYTELANRLVDMAHEEKGSNR